MDNIGKAIDSAIDRIKAIAPSIQWAAIGFVAGVLTTWFV